MHDQAMPIPVSNRAARRFLIERAELAGRPSRASDRAGLYGTVERLGFVQLDSINIVERAHHHILWSRLHAYRPAMLDGLQRKGRIFEHWTHDASVLPAEVFPHWRTRFGHVAWGSWLKGKMGKDHAVIAAAVLARIRAEGPLMARDFEHAGRKSGPWWDWKPAKAALEYWWRTGELAVPRRINFQKVYDLTERVLPEVHGLAAPAREAHVEWACAGALERLGAATPKEISGFWGTVTLAEARAWSGRAVADGRAVAAGLQSHGGEGTRPGIAVADWRERAASLPDPPAGMRLLSPFDPLIRDRARCLRLFGFDYRFEAFVPEAKRKHGYYVLPVLEGERLVARVDPKLDRETGTLRIRGVWWEGKPTRRGRKALGAAVERYGALMDAERVELGA